MASFAGAATTRAPGPGIPLRVLVVDDEALIRWSVTQTLADAGMQVEQAGTGAAALAALAAGRFDVVVLDLRLPDVDDLWLVSAVRREYPKSSIVLMTAFGTAEVMTTAQALGVRAVLNKPFELDEIANAVSAARAPA